MRFKIATVKFVRTFEVKVLTPVDLDVKTLNRIAQDEASDGLRDYDPPDWYVSSISSSEVDIDPATLRLQTLPGYARIQRPVADVFKDGDVMVVDAEKRRFACPEDEEWWQVDEDQLDEIRAQERRLQDINHPDQMPLFGGK